MAPKCVFAQNAMVYCNFSFGHKKLLKNIVILTLAYEIKPKLLKTKPKTDISGLKRKLKGFEIVENVLHIFFLYFDKMGELNLPTILDDRKDHK